MARKKENKRSDGYYEVKCVVDHTFDGKAIYKSFYSRKSKADARLKAEEYKKKKSSDAEKSMKLFSDVAEEFLEIKKEQVRESSFMFGYKSIVVTTLIPYFKNCYIEAITIEDINAFMRAHKDLKRTTLNNFRNKLKCIFAYAYENNYIQHDIMVGYTLQYGKKSGEKRTYTPEQCALVLEYCKNHRYGLEVHLMLSYGLSRSELLGIRIESINFEDKTISISHAVVVDGNYEATVEETKNKFRNRDIAVSEETLKMIKATGLETGFLFQYNGRVMTPNGMTRRIKAFMKDMHEYYGDKDIPMLNPHELRHTRASIWVNEGRNLFAIAQQMGWADLDMMRKRYAHADINQLRKELGL